jgi:multidrug resistance efflux pump
MAVGDINLDEERRQAELAKLRAEAELLEAQNRKARAETEFKMRAEIEQLIAETKKMDRESRWYPLIAVAAFVTSLFAAYKVFHG